MSLAGACPHEVGRVFPQDGVRVRDPLRRPVRPVGLQLETMPNLIARVLRSACRKGVSSYLGSGSSLVGDALKSGRSGPSSLSVALGLGNDAWGGCFHLLYPSEGMFIRFVHSESLAPPRVILNFVGCGL